MRTDETIIRHVIGDSEFSLRGRRPRESESSGLRTYRIHLPAGYRHGFPPIWDFALVPDRAKPRSEAERRALIEDAESLIGSRPKVAGAVPLLIMSADEAIDLNSDLPPDHPNAFYIDAPELTVPPKGQLELFFSPFMRAIRRKFSEQDARAQLMTPYIPGKPATEWRFFGRERELQRLVLSPQNFIVIGARRVGKTSLLREVERRLIDAKATTFFVDVQDVSDEATLVDRLLEKIDPARHASLLRRKEVIHEGLLGPSLRLISGQRDAVLLVDEIGNVIQRMPKDAWKVLGVIRSFAQSGKLRVIATASQEFFLRQQEDFYGPWVNFATALRLGGFSADEVEDFVIKPLRLWGLLPNRTAMLELVSSAVGTNPFLLAKFCNELFQQTIKSKVNPDALNVAQNLLKNDMVRTFHDAIQDLFYNIPSPTLQYLFLRRCHEYDQRNQAIDTVTFDIDWIDEALLHIGFESSVMLRRNLLDDMRVRGLTEPVDGNPNTQAVIAPLIYHVVKKSERDLERLIERYGQEIAREADRRGLVPLRKTYS